MRSKRAVFSGAGEKERDKAVRGRLRGVLSAVGANALLFAIALALFFALGLREGGSVRAGASPLGFASGRGGNSAVYRGRSSGRAALLIPVSWESSALTDILAALEGANARATFALSGSFAEKNAVFIKKIADMGHEIALMAEQGADELAFAELKSGLQSTLLLIENILGKRPEVMFTGRSERSIRAAAALSLTAVEGSLDLVCERGDAGQLLSRARGNISQGDIVICAPTAAFAEAAAGILNYFSDSGLTAATVSGTMYD